MSAEAGRTPGARRILVAVLATVGGMILLAVFALFALGVLGVSSNDDFEPVRVADKAGKTVHIVENIGSLNGTNLIRMDIAASQSGDASSVAFSSGGRSSDIRNILLLDKNTGATRKLLPDQRRRIAATQFLPARADVELGPLNDQGVYQDAGDAPLAYYLLTVRQTNQPHVLDLLVGSLASGRQAFVMRGVTGVESTWMQSETQIGMIVREGLELYYRIVDVPTLKVVTSRKVDIV